VWLQSKICTFKKKVFTTDVISGSCFYIPSPNLLNFLLGVLGPEDGSSSAADMLTRGLSLGGKSSNTSGSLIAP